jgi:hypothetical protein
MKVEISDAELESLVREEVKRIADIIFRAHLREIVCMECEHYVKILVNKMIEENNNALRPQISKWITSALPDNIEGLVEEKVSSILDTKVLKFIDEEYAHDDE